MTEKKITNICIYTKKKKSKAATILDFVTGHEVVVDTRLLSSTTLSIFCLLSGKISPMWALYLVE